MIKRALRNWLKDNDDHRYKDHGWVPVKKPNGKSNGNGIAQSEAMKFAQALKGRLDAIDSKLKDLRADLDLMRPKATKMELYEKRIKSLDEVLANTIKDVIELKRRAKYWWQR